MHRNPKAIGWFPSSSYPPAFPFIGPPPPCRLPSPPTRRLEIEGSRIVERGEIPVVVIPVSVWQNRGEASQLVRARGQPPLDG